MFRFNIFFSYFIPSYWLPAHTQSPVELTERSGGALVRGTYIITKHKFVKTNCIILWIRVIPEYMEMC